MNDNQTDFPFVQELTTLQRATTQLTLPETAQEKPPETERATMSADRPAVTDPLAQNTASGVSARARKKRAADKRRGLVRIETRLEKKIYSVVRRMAKKRKTSVSAWASALIASAAAVASTAQEKLG